MKTFKDYLKENKELGEFTKEYYKPLKPAQRSAIERALGPIIKMYMRDGYDVTLRTEKDANRGTSVAVFIRKGKTLSTLVAHKSMGPNGKLVDVFPV